MRKIFICTLLFMIFCFYLVRPASADELSGLKAQMKKIQQENQRLQEQLNTQKEVTGRLLKKVEALESKDEVLSKEVKILKEKPVEFVLKEEIEIPGLADIPKLNIKGFTDFGLTAEITNSEDNSTFSVGHFDLFITSEISDKVSFFAEPALHFNTDTNATDFELERAHLTYSFSDLLNMKIGRMHTPLGYWNKAYHHGVWLQTPVFRPEIVKFEDDGGVLPLHAVGIELSGIKEFDSFGLEYNFNVANGRGRTKTEVQNTKDKNDSKALNFLLGFKPNFVEGLKFGADIYYDKIPSNPGTSTRTNRINELILGGYATYFHDKIELLGELFNISHDDKTSGNDFDTLGFYLQGGYKIDNFTPYWRFDFIDFGNADPYFTPDDTDIKKHTLGLRWDVFTWNALKFEYSYADKKDKDNEHSIAVNSSFAF